MAVVKNEHTNTWYVHYKTKDPVTSKDVWHKKEASGLSGKP